MSFYDDSEGEGDGGVDVRIIPRKKGTAAVADNVLVKGSRWIKLPASVDVGQDIMNMCLKTDRENPLLPPSEKGYIRSMANNRVNLILVCNQKNKEKFNYPPPL